MLLLVGLPIASVAQRVGIGTTTPQERLDVAGNARVQGLSGTGIRLVTANPTGVLNTLAGTAAGQLLVWDGTQWVPGTSGTISVNVGAGLTGNGLTANPITLNASTTGPITGNGTPTSPITFSAGTAAGQTWIWNGTTWVLGTPLSSVNSSGAITGDGSAATPIKLIDGTAPNQILLWDGTQWLLTSFNPTVTTDATLSGNGTAANPLTIAQQGATNGQVLAWNGTSWAPANVSGDNWGTQTAVTDATLTGNGTAGNPLGIAQQGATNGQVLAWNGTSWAPANVSGDNWGTQVAITQGPIIGTGVVANPIKLIDGTAPNQVLVWNGTSWLPASRSVLTAGVITGSGVVGDSIRLVPGNSDEQILQWNNTTGTWEIVTFSGWKIDGNLGTNPAINFIGTRDTRDFVTRTNNIERMRVTSSGDVGIGTATPARKFHIVSSTTGQQIDLTPGNISSVYNGSVFNATGNGTTPSSELNNLRIVTQG
ncbi:MAG: hypothetical protein NZ108_09255, partial [Bacteroidia bacterium]|nr:hypothetical protein [Bacteroidia bacterium]